MPRPLTRHALSILLCLLLLAPAQMPWPASGSAILHSPADFKGGTVNNTTAETQGLLLGRTTVPDDWMLQGCVFSPPTICSPAFGYDSVLGASYLVGRSRTTTGKATVEAWKYDAGNDQWARLPAGAMPDTVDGAGFYDDNKSRMIVLSANASAAHSYTNDGNWAPLNPASSPTARTGYSLAFDNSSRKAYLFGGVSGGAYPNDTWVYDAAANTWTSPSTSVAPPGRANATMAYDRSNGVVILYGGSVTVGGLKTLQGDTWVYSPGNSTWTNKTPATSPPAREFSAMVHCPPNDTVLFGGVISGSKEFVNDTWTYRLSGNAWTNRTNDSAPAPRSRHSMAYDAGKGLLIMAGGLGHAEYNWRADSWSLDGKTWNWAMGTRNAPSWRTGAEYAQDARNGTFYIFGGDDGAFVPDALNTRLYCGDTWKFDGCAGKWTLLSPTRACQNLSVRSGLRTSWGSEASGSTMVYDGRNRDLMLFGPMAGSTKLAENHTYLFNLSSREWKDLGASFNGNAASGVFSATYNPRTGETFLFGGTENGLYTLNRARPAWESCNASFSTPNNFDDASMVCLESTGELLLYGSIAHSPVTFIYTNNSWSKKPNANDPPARTRFSMVYDSFRDEAVLAGGEVSNLPADETWCYNVTAQAWTKLNPPTPFPKMSCPTSFYCGPQNEVHMLGGVGSPSSYPFLYSFDRRNYCQTGDYNSTIIDTGGESYFGRISWSADLPDNTSILARVRSGANLAALNASKFTGKNANASGYYTNGDWLHSVHNNSQYIQYRLFLSSKSNWSSPLLKSINITYNRKHSVSINSPTNTSNWTGKQTINWTIFDPEKAVMSWTVTLLYPDGRTPKTLASGNGTRPFVWDTTNTSSGVYRICVTVTDDNKEIPLSVSAISDNFTIFHPNRAPTVSLSWPENSQEINTSSITLGWTSKDLDNDTLNYKVYVSTSEFTEESLPDPWELTGNTNSTRTNLEDKKYYYWTVIANDGQENSTVPEVWSFWVNLYNSPPMVTLTFPENGTDVDSTSTQLTWMEGSNDGDKITYSVFLGIAIFDVSSLPPAKGTTNNTYFILEDLTDMTTYYWTVIGNDGKVNGNMPSVWKFTVNMSDTPRIIFKYPNETTTNVTCSPTIIVEFNLEMDIQSVHSAFSIDPNRFSILYTPQEKKRFCFGFNAPLEPLTTYTITIGTSARSVAGKNLPQPYTWYFITKNNGGSDLPTWLLTIPGHGENPLVQKTVSIVFNNDMNQAVTKRACVISPSIGGDWEWVSTTVIQYVLKDGFPNGTYTVTISSSARDIHGNPFDGNKNNKTEGAADDYVFTFTVGINDTVRPRLVKKTPENGMQVPIGTALVLEFDLPMNFTSVSAALTITPHVDGCWTFDPAELHKFTYTPLNNLTPGKTYRITLASTAKRINGNLLDQNYSWSFNTVPLNGGDPVPKWLIPAILATVVAVGFAAALSRRGRASARRVAAAAPRGFAIDDIFLMYNDGRLIQHTTRRLRADMDVDIFTSMLTALQGFVKESVGRDSGGELGSMEYGGNKVLLEKGKYVVVAVVITGGEPAGFRDDMRAAVRNIEGELGAVLSDWDGSVARLAGAQMFLERLGSYRAAEEPAAAAAAKVDVSVRSELEFYQGFVRLKVAVKNNMDTMIAKSTFKLIFNESVLRLDRIEPPVESRGDELVLGIIEPGEKKTVAFYLDPQICTESHVEGVLTFKDARGNLETVKMPRKLASVVCPVLFTDENINTAMLKRMAAEELDKKDSKVFTIPSTMTPEKAFEVGKAAVQHHDLRLVRELREDKPFRAEAWYFGKAKGRPDRLVVSVRVIPEMTFLEFSVSSDSLLMLTGMLAELKTDLNKELEAHHLKGAMKQVTDRDDMEAVAEIRLLLEKAKEPDGG